MKKIFIVGSNNNAALAITQDLGLNHNVKCFGFNEDFNKVEYSKFLNSYHNISKNSSLNEIEDVIVEIVNNEEIDVIIPTNDRFTLLLSRNSFRKRIKNALISTPDYEKLIKGMDKLSITKIAQEVGLKTPFTFEIDKFKNYSFPIFLKSRVSWGIYENKFERGLLKKIQNEDELSQILPSVDNEKVYMQEEVHGDGWGFEIIAKDGVLMNYFAHLRLRESNPKGGYSSAAMSIMPHDFYLKKVSEILKKIEWTGVAMFEFKGDYLSKESNLIEMNCRFWGSLPVALHSGNRFPYLLLQVLDGNKIDQPKYKSNVKVRWIQADIIHFIKVLFLKNRSSYNLPSVFATFKNVFLLKMKSYNRYNGDWKPGLYELTLGFLKKGL